MRTREGDQAGRHPGGPTPWPLIQLYISVSNLQEYNHYVNKWGTSLRQSSSALAHEHRRPAFSTPLRLAVVGEASTVSAAMTTLIPLRTLSEALVS
jgi:hypothetical protein